MMVFVEEKIKKISFSNARQHTRISSVQVVEPAPVLDFSSNYGQQTMVGRVVGGGFMLFLMLQSPRSFFFVSKSSSHLRRGLLSCHKEEEWK